MGGAYPHSKINRPDPQPSEGVCSKGKEGNTPAYPSREGKEVPLGDVKASLDGGDLAVRIRIRSLPSGLNKTT